MKKNTLELDNPRVRFRVIADVTIVGQLFWEVINMGDHTVIIAAKETLYNFNIPSGNFNICHLETGRVQDITLQLMFFSSRIL